MKKNRLLIITFIFFAAYVLFNAFETGEELGEKWIKQISTSQSFKKAMIDKKENIKAGKRIDSKNKLEASANLGVTAKNETTSILQTEASTAIEKFFNEAPRTDSLKGLTEAEVHLTPKSVLKAGEYLANMRQFFIDNPQPRGIEMGFYLKCSQQKDFFDSVRAICAARLSQQYFEATGHQISEQTFEPKIEELKNQITL